MKFIIPEFKEPTDEELKASSEKWWSNYSAFQEMRKKKICECMPLISN